MRTAAYSTGHVRRTRRTSRSRVGMVRKDRRAGGPDLREWFAGVHQAGFRRTAVRLVVPAGPVDCLLAVGRAAGASGLAWPPGRGLGQ